LITGWQEASQDPKAVSRLLWNELNLVVVGDRVFQKSDEQNNLARKSFSNSESKDCSEVTSLRNILSSKHPTEKLGTLQSVECYGDVSFLVLSDGIPRHILGSAIQNQFAS